MKSTGRILSLRGTSVGTTAGGLNSEKVFTYEGTDLSRAWKIKSIDVIDYNDPIGSEAEGIIVQTMERYQTRFDLGNNQVIGFVGSYASEKSVLDPNHVIVENLWISNIDTMPANYLIILEELSITPTENIIHRIKNRGQNFSVG